MKKNHGNKRVIIETDAEMSEIDSIPGVKEVTRTKRDIKVEIDNEAVATEIFDIVTSYGFVKRFEVVEPSLNEIFIEKVGDYNG